MKKLLLLTGLFILNYTSFGQAPVTNKKHGFTFTCGKNIFYVFVTNDSIVIKPDNSISSSYYNPSQFSAADFTAWLSAKYSNVLAPECAVRLGTMANDEIYFNNPSPATCNGCDKNVVTAMANNLVHLAKKTTAINPIYSKDSVRIERIKITLTRDKPPLATDTDHINFKVDKKLFPFTPVVFPATLAIPARAWSEGEDQITFDTVIYLKNQTIYSSLKQDATTYIEIAGDEKSFHTVRLTEAGMYTPTQPFWVELGTNFDLLDGIDANNFYSGIYMFDQDIAAFKKNKNISFTAGVYESKATSSSLTSDSGFTYRNDKSYSLDAAHNGYPYYRSSGSLSTVTSVKNIGLFFSPYLRISDRPVKENGFHWFISFYAEMLWQKVTTNIDYSKTTTDTLYLPQSNSIDTSIYNYPFKETQYSSDFRSHYVGIGLPIYIKENNYNFYLNTVFGFSTQKFILVQTAVTDARKYVINTFPNGKINNGIGAGYATPRHFLNPFYLFQFKLNEDKYGITITGEIRGLIALPGAKPVVALSLSKKFDLGELFTTIVKPFSLGK